ncbi:MAG: phosphate regulon sensor protein PhoR, partial [Gammaproteobacteria bacterium]
MKPDIYRLTGTLLVFLLPGLIIGHILLFLCLGLLAYLYWQHKMLHRLLQWMRNRSEADPPYIPGLFDAIAGQYESLRIRYKKSKLRLAGYLRRFKEATQALP